MMRALIRGGGANGIVVLLQRSTSDIVRRRRSLLTMIFLSPACASKRAYSWADVTVIRLPAVSAGASDAVVIVWLGCCYGVVSPRRLKFSFGGCSIDAFERYGSETIELAVARKGFCLRRMNKIERDQCDVFVILWQHCCVPMIWHWYRWSQASWLFSCAEPLGHLWLFFKYTIAFYFTYVPAYAVSETDTHV